jgi:ring-1,2-phenylacetyl-CoA epoxidase subunit PaaD
VSEYGTHVAIARARAGLTDPLPGHGAATPAPLDVALVRSILATIPDPELPILSIVDLGMVDRVEVGPTAIQVTLLPTFVGCPAIDLIRATVGEALAPLGRTVDVATSFDPPWTSDRISEAGLTSLAAAGIAPPSEPSLVRCPMCDSPRVVMDSVFGPTQCRSLFYCRDCRQPFEAMKPV